jgi:hypothetical protein
VVVFCHFLTTQQDPLQVKVHITREGGVLFSGLLPTAESEYGEHKQKACTLLSPQVKDPMAYRFMYAGYVHHLPWQQSQP